MPKVPKVHEPKDPIEPEGLKDSIVSRATARRGYASYIAAGPLATKAKTKKNQLLGEA